MNVRRYKGKYSHQWELCITVCVGECGVGELWVCVCVTASHEPSDRPLVNLGKQFSKQRMEVDFLQRQEGIQVKTLPSAPETTHASALVLQLG